MTYSPRAERDWRAIADEVSRERDPQKMVELIRELLLAYDEEHKAAEPDFENRSRGNRLSKSA